VEKASKLKGPGFLTFIKGIPIILLYNIKTSSGLINNITSIIKKAILNINI
jgi:hypothetical protein